MPMSLLAVTEPAAHLVVLNVGTITLREGGRAPAPTVHNLQVQYVTSLGSMMLHDVQNTHSLNQVGSTAQQAEASQANAGRAGEQASGHLTFPPAGTSVVLQKSTTLASSCMQHSTGHPWQAFRESARWQTARSHLCIRMQVGTANRMYSCPSMDPTGSKKVPCGCPGC